VSPPAARVQVIAVGLVLAVGLAVTLALSGGDGRPASRTAGLPLATAVVERRTLTERELVDGTLGFADPRPLAHGGRGEPAVVTWLAPEGSIVRRGEPLYRVDDRPVALLYGRLPAYRSLREGARGRDVAQLERNLAALGVTQAAMAVDRSYTAATSEAVRTWQRRRGLRPTGSIGAGQIAFLPGARRVGAHSAHVGTRLGAGAPVMQTSGLKRVVTVELPASRQTLVERGDQVRVTLPRGRADGRIERVGRVARRRREGEPGQFQEPFIELTIGIGAGPQVAGLDEAPVTVAIERASRPHVLAVPITALLARAGGGFALESAGPDRRMREVGIGLAADGYVEVAGRGVREGMRVVAAE
jgi:hypothetical protein